MSINGQLAVRHRVTRAWAYSIYKVWDLGFKLGATAFFFVFFLMFSGSELKGNCAPKCSSSYSQSSVGNIYLGKTQSRYDNGKLVFFEEMCFRWGGGGAITPPPPLMSSVTSSFISHCTVRVLYAYLMYEEAVKVAAVPVQKMLHWQLLFARTTTRTRLVLTSLIHGSHHSQSPNLPGQNKTTN